jgi:hypothetical protein
VQGRGVRVVGETSDEAALRREAGKADLTVRDGRVTLMIGSPPAATARR